MDIFLLCSPTFPRYGVVRLTVTRSDDSQAENDAIVNMVLQVNKTACTMTVCCTQCPQSSEFIFLIIHLEPNSQNQGASATHNRIMGIKNSTILNQPQTILNPVFRLSNFSRNTMS